MSRHIQHYEQFGAAVYDIIRSHMGPDGRISDLLIKLHLPVTADVDQQHQILAKFLFQFGVTFFLEAIAQRDPEEIERMKTRRLLEGIGIKRKEGTVPRSAASAAGINATPLPSEPASSTPPASPQPSGPKHISVPGYDGPDRRRGRDRRMARKDRRTRVDIVYHNHRFGGRDRRKTVRQIGRAHV